MYSEAAAMVIVELLSSVCHEREKSVGERTVVCS